MNDFQPEKLKDYISQLDNLFSDQKKAHSALETELTTIRTELVRPEPDGCSLYPNLEGDNSLNREAGGLNVEVEIQEWLTLLQQRIGTVEDDFKVYKEKFVTLTQLIQTHKKELFQLPQMMAASLQKSLDLVEENKALIAENQILKKGSPTLPSVDETSPPKVFHHSFPGMVPPDHSSVEPSPPSVVHQKASSLAPQDPSNDAVVEWASWVFQTLTQLKKTVDPQGQISLPFQSPLLQWILSSYPNRPF